MIIPWQELEEETLTNIIETFVLREGTDYGDIEKSLSDKVADVMKQLEKGLVVIVWSESHETIDLKCVDVFNEPDSH